MTYAWIKRGIDIAGASISLLLLTLPLAVLAICVAVFMGRPVFFRQQRVGLRGKPFTILKFRTMKDAVDSAGQTLPDDQRLTRFGRFLRSASLDELPELWNVLKGDMSLVGPRPLLPEYLPYYDAEQARRHDVRPGLTGWAQVNGRNAVSWDERLRLDVEYVKQMSFSMDMKILGSTVLAVLRREGISAEGHATMTRFDDEMKRRRSERGG